MLGVPNMGAGIPIHLWEPAWVVSCCPRGGEGRGGWFCVETVGRWGVEESGGEWQLGTVVGGQLGQEAVEIKGFASG
jgi:hypothetical protein